MEKSLSLAESARTLVQQASRAMLSTVSDQAGIPYGSVVEFAPTPQGDIVMLMSQLAEHQHFIAADPRASILIAPEINAPDALAKPRVSLLGRVEKFDGDSAIRDDYLQRHPSAEMYLQLGDFHFYQLHVEHVRYIAGFGKMGWLSAADYRDAEPDLLWEIAASAIEHMNDDHGNNLIEYVRVLADKPWVERATLTHIDRYGMDISATGQEEHVSVRIPFEPPLSNANELRIRLTKMAQKIRADKSD